MVKPSPLCRKVCDYRIEFWVLSIQVLLTPRERWPNGKAESDGKSALLGF